jgi:predicted ArsR family transcriptional regulator
MRGTTPFLVSTSTKTILKALLATKDGLSYQDLSKKCKVPINTLYVFCQRLESARLVRRQKKVAGNPIKVRTLIQVSTPDLQFPTVKVIR